MLARRYRKRLLSPPQFSFKNMSNGHFIENESNKTVMSSFIQECHELNSGILFQVIDKEIKKFTEEINEISQSNNSTAELKDALKRRLSALKKMQTKKKVLEEMRGEGKSLSKRASDLAAAYSDQNECIIEEAKKKDSEDFGGNFETCARLFLNTICSWIKNEIENQKSYTPIIPYYTKETLIEGITNLWLENGFNRKDVPEIKKVVNGALKGKNFDDSIRDSHILMQALFLRTNSILEEVSEDLKEYRDISGDNMEGEYKLFTALTYEELVEVQGRLHKLWKKTSKLPVKEHVKKQLRHDIKSARQKVAATVTNRLINREVPGNKKDVADAMNFVRIYGNYKTYEVTEGNREKVLCKLETETLGYSEWSNWWSYFYPSESYKRSRVYECKRALKDVGYRSRKSEIRALISSAKEQGGKAFYNEMFDRLKYAKLGAKEGIPGLKLRQGIKGKSFGKQMVMGSGGLGVIISEGEIIDFDTLDAGEIDLVIDYLDTWMEDKKNQPGWRERLFNFEKNRRFRIVHRLKETFIKQKEYVLRNQTVKPLKEAIFENFDKSFGELEKMEVNIKGFDVKIFQSLEISRARKKYLEIMNGHDTEKVLLSKNKAGKWYIHDLRYVYRKTATREQRVKIDGETDVGKKILEKLNDEENHDHDIDEIKVLVTEYLERDNVDKITNINDKTYRIRAQKYKVFCTINRLRKLLSKDNRQNLSPADIKIEMGKIKELSEDISKLQKEVGGIDSKLAITANAVLDQIGKVGKSIDFTGIFGFMVKRVAAPVAERVLGEQPTELVKLDTICKELKIVLKDFETVNEQMKSLNTIGAGEAEKESVKINLDSMEMSEENLDYLKGLLTVGGGNEKEESPYFELKKAFGKNTVEANIEKVAKEKSLLNCVLDGRESTYGLEKLLKQVEEHEKIIRSISVYEEMLKNNNNKAMLKGLQIFKGVLMGKAKGRTKELKKNLRTIFGIDLENGNQNQDQDIFRNCRINAAYNRLFTLLAHGKLRGADAKELQPMLNGMGYKYKDALKNASSPFKCGLDGEVDITVKHYFDAGILAHIIKNKEEAGELAKKQAEGWKEKIKTEINTYLEKYDGKNARYLPYVRYLHEQKLITDDVLKKILEKRFEHISSTLLEVQNQSASTFEFTKSDKHFFDGYSNELIIQRLAGKEKEIFNEVFEKKILQQLKEKTVLLPNKFVNYIGKHLNERNRENLYRYQTDQLFARWLSEPSSYIKKLKSFIINGNKKAIKKVLAKKLNKLMEKGEEVEKSAWEKVSIADRYNLLKDVFIYIDKKTLGKCYNELLKEVLIGENRNSIRECLPLLMRLELIYKIKPDLSILNEYLEKDDSARLSILDKRAQRILKEHLPADKKGEFYKQRIIALIDKVVKEENEENKKELLDKLDSKYWALSMKYDKELNDDKLLVSILEKINDMPEKKELRNSEFIDLCISRLNKNNDNGLKAAVKKCLKTIYEDICDSQEESEQESESLLRYAINLDKGTLIEFVNELVKEFLGKKVVAIDPESNPGIIHDLYYNVVFTREVKLEQQDLKLANRWEARLFFSKMIHHYKSPNNSPEDAESIFGQVNDYNEKEVFEFLNEELVAFYLNDDFNTEEDKRIKDAIEELAAKQEDNANFLSKIKAFKAVCGALSSGELLTEMEQIKALRELKKYSKELGYSADYLDSTLQKLNESAVRRVKSTCSNNAIRCDIALVAQDYVFSEYRKCMNSESIDLEGLKTRFETINAFLAEETQKTFASVLSKVYKFEVDEQFYTDVSTLFTYISKLPKDVRINLAAKYFGVATFSKSTLNAVVDINNKLNVYVHEQLLLFLTDCATNSPSELKVENVKGYMKAYDLYTKVGDFSGFLKAIDNILKAVVMRESSNKENGLKILNDLVKSKLEKFDELRDPENEDIRAHLLNTAKEYLTKEKQGEFLEVMKDEWSFYKDKLLPFCRDNEYVKKAPNRDFAQRADYFILDNCKSPERVSLCRKIFEQKFSQEAFALLSKGLDQEAQCGCERYYFETILVGDLFNMVKVEFTKFMEEMESTLRQAVGFCYDKKYNDDWQENLGERLLLLVKELEKENSAEKRPSIKQDLLFKIRLVNSCVKILNEKNGVEGFSETVGALTAENELASKIMKLAMKPEQLTEKGSKEIDEAIEKLDENQANWFADHFVSILPEGDLKKSLIFESSRADNDFHKMYLLRQLQAKLKDFGTRNLGSHEMKEVVRALVNCNKGKVDGDRIVRNIQGVIDEVGKENVQGLLKSHLLKILMDKKDNESLEKDIDDEFSFCLGLSRLVGLNVSRLEFNEEHLKEADEFIAKFHSNERNELFKQIVSKITNEQVKVAFEKGLKHPGYGCSMFFFEKMLLNALDTWESSEVANYVENTKAFFKKFFDIRKQAKVLEGGAVDDRLSEVKKSLESVFEVQGNKYSKLSLYFKLKAIDFYMEILEKGGKDENLELDKMLEFTEMYECFTKLAKLTDSSKLTSEFALKVDKVVTYLGDEGRKDFMTKVLPIFPDNFAKEILREELHKPAAGFYKHFCLQKLKNKLECFVNNKSFTEKEIEVLYQEFGLCKAARVSGEKIGLLVNSCGEAFAKIIEGKDSEIQEFLKLQFGKVLDICHKEKYEDNLHCTYSRLLQPDVVKMVEVLMGCTSEEEARQKIAADPALFLEFHAIISELNTEQKRCINKLLASKNVYSKFLDLFSKEKPEYSMRGIVLNQEFMSPLCKLLDEKNPDWRMVLEKIKRIVKAALEGDAKAKTKLGLVHRLRMFDFKVLNNYRNDLKKDGKLNEDVYGKFGYHLYTICDAFVRGCLTELCKGNGPDSGLIESAFSAYEALREDVDVLQLKEDENYENLANLYQKYFTRGDGVLKKSYPKYYSEKEIWMKQKGVDHKNPNSVFIKSREWANYKKEILSENLEHEAPFVYDRCVEAVQWQICQRIENQINNTEGNAGKIANLSCVQDYMCQVFDRKISLLNLKQADAKDGKSKDVGIEIARKMAQYHNFLDEYAKGEKGKQLILRKIKTVFERFLQSEGNEFDDDSYSRAFICVKIFKHVVGKKDTVCRKEAERMFERLYFKKYVVKCKGKISEKIAEISKLGEKPQKSQEEIRKELEGVIQDLDEKNEKGLQEVGEGFVSQFKGLRESVAKDLVMASVKAKSENAKQAIEQVLEAHFKQTKAFIGREYLKENCGSVKQLPGLYRAYCNGASKMLEVIEIGVRNVLFFEDSIQPYFVKAYRDAISWGDEDSLEVWERKITLQNTFREQVIDLYLSNKEKAKSFTRIYFEKNPSLANDKVKNDVPVIASFDDFVKEVEARRGCDIAGKDINLVIELLCDNYAKYQVELEYCRDASEVTSILRSILIQYLDDYCQGKGCDPVMAKLVINTLFDSDGRRNLAQLKYGVASKLPEWGRNGTSMQTIFDQEVDAVCKRTGVNEPTKAIYAYVYQNLLKVCEYKNFEIAENEQIKFLLTNYDEKFNRGPVCDKIQNFIGKYIKSKIKTEDFCKVYANISKMANFPKTDGKAACTGIQKYVVCKMAKELSKAEGKAEHKEEVQFLLKYYDSFDWCAKGAAKKMLTHYTKLKVGFGQWGRSEWQGKAKKFLESLDGFVKIKEGKPGFFKKTSGNKEVPQPIGGDLKGRQNGVDMQLVAKRTGSPIHGCLPKNRGGLGVEEQKNEDLVY